MQGNHTDIGKKLCLERDAYRCRTCGSSESLKVCQLTERSGFLAWHVSNLITLCSDCAGKREYNIKNNKDSKKVGVILCGGKGTRLFPQTKFTNKHELPIGLIPMLFYPLKTLREFGVYRTVIVIDRENTNKIIEMVGSGKEFGMDVSYRVQDGSGGISEALYLAKDFVREDDQVVCILGDNIFDNGGLDTNVFLNTESNLSYGPRACVYLKQVKQPEAYGIAILDENKKITKIIEKPKEFVGNMAVVGLYLYTSHVFRVIEGIEPSERGELEVSSLNDYYAVNNLLDYRTVNEYWGDAGGSINDYAKCSMHGAKEANVSSDDIEEFRSIVFDTK